jgi:tRNA nucleotidyltransferase/poly(A) polymerase
MLQNIIKKHVKKLLNEGYEEDVLIEYISNLIKGSLFENKVYIAGGFVRDKLMGKSSKDIDFVVNLPNGGIRFANFIAKKTGSYKPESNPVIYERFGTAKFNLRGINYKGVDLSDIDLESVMTRTEKYDSDSRKPETAYGSLEQDVYRRDLTINSLLLNISNNEILDLTNKGIDDIKNNVIRTPLDPDMTFNDDPLRMLRTIRFTTRYNSNIPQNILDSIKTNADKLNKISKERILDEFNKIILTDKPSEGIKLLMDTNLMQYIIPEYYNIVGLTQNKYHQFDVFEHSMFVLDNSKKELIVRLSALFHDLGKYKTRTDVGGKVQFLGHDDIGSVLTNDIMKRMGYPNSVIKSVTNIVKHHMRTKPFGDEAKTTDKALRKIIIDLADDLENFLELVHSDNISHGEGEWEYNMKNQVDRIREKLKNLDLEKRPNKLPISGDRIMKLLNIKPSSEVGNILNKLTDKYLENPNIFDNISDDKLIELIKN